MSARPKGRPGGNPSRPDHRPEPRPSVASIVANAMAAEALMPDLDEQFSALDVNLRKRVFRLLDLVGEKDHDELVELRLQISGLRQFFGLSVELIELIDALDSIVLFLDRRNTPVVDGEPQGDLASRILEHYAAQHPTEQKGA